MNKILIFIIVLLSIIYLNISSTTHSTTIFLDKTIKVKQEDKINELKLEDYILGVVAAEMPASFNLEALKAQAIAARSYALSKMGSNTSYDILASVSNQSYITKSEMYSIWKDNYDYYYNKIYNAVNDTKGIVMKYNSKVIEAYYFAMSNGYTEKSSLVFYEDLDYLESVIVEEDNDTLKDFSVSTSFTKNDFCNKLNITCNNITISNINRSLTNRVITITINNKTFKGTDFRKLLSLRSTDFDIDIKDTINITTRGFGHGVGMSQYGANGMANKGYSYKEILEYYYKNITLEKI
jgi:stage II sporulation protein D